MLMYKLLNHLFLLTTMTLLIVSVKKLSKLFNNTYQKQLLMVTMLKLVLKW